MKTLKTILDRKMYLVLEILNRIFDLEVLEFGFEIDEHVDKEEELKNRRGCLMIIQWE